MIRNALWHDIASAREEWLDAQSLEDGELQGLLDAAQYQCELYAPAREETWPDWIPHTYRLAHLMQARNLWNASTVDENGGQGNEFSTRVFPMDWTVKNLLRPKRGLPVMF